jgi:hypothetical protein
MEIPMSDGFAAELKPLVSHEQVENAFHAALNLFVGRGRRHSAAEVAVGAGVHRRTLDCYRGYPVGHPDHRPLDVAQKFSLASFIGADLTAAWIGFMGQGAFNLPEHANHDDIATDCIDYAGLHARARHPDSPAGVDICPKAEEPELGRMALRLVGKVRA